MPQENLTVFSSFDYVQEKKPKTYVLGSLYRDIWIESFIQFNI